MRIGVDAMGGDYAPQAIVRGALEALPSMNGHELVLIGDEKAIRQELERSGNKAADKVQIVHTSQVIGMDEIPVEAVRQKKDSSICRMVQMAARGELDGVISAGNTGAFAAASQLRMRLLPGVSRTGIAVVIPSFTGPIVLCDAGANLAPKPHHLVQYAHMAGAYANHVLKVARPRVALLSVGEEDVKGTALVKTVHEKLRADGRINFVGNVEGRDLFRGGCDVVITDGFVGNIVLKLIEGLAEGLFKTIAKEIALASPELARSFDPVIKRVWANHDYAEYGGAPLLGVDGACIICHGRSDHVAIRNAVRVAMEYLDKNVNSVIAAELAEAR
ncbi:MAG TPA: phosphate acyltransferase PlsX [Phycisphaerae bacterium]|jgi:glycerol-3-phosphate acyltransferase PlsX|nr:phosphate acyltransferase PlsX [Phycisphaerae bacterium]HOJ55778.1 phosphate acyltransferase PlsX [Phycisphaerae bacterium]HOL25735.1 phosphate acyltransferase PlsX [Phycisphaerae bacterium]HPP19572.1 phosphate acyltransferase PlsX [Phycisphaerae bacterium]HPU32685.1 phosphate acyltransferase PlsX [Phycisphaerae bacterium]